MPWLGAVRVKMSCLHLAAFGCIACIELQRKARRARKASRNANRMVDSLSLHGQSRKSNFENHKSKRERKVKGLHTRGDG